MRPILSTWVTFFVIFGAVAASLSSWADDPTTMSTEYGKIEIPVDVTLRVAGEEVPVTGNSPLASIGGSLAYNFYKTYAVGVEFSYEHPFTQFQDYIYNGGNDLAFYLTDKEILKNEEMGLTVQAKVSGIVPTSPASKQASMHWGMTEALITTKKFTDTTKLIYTAAANEYYYDYGVAAINTDGSLTYNIRLSVSNRLMFSYDPIKDLHLQIGGGINTYNDYNNQTYNIYSIATGIAYDVDKSVSFDIGLKTSLKNSSYDATYNGPATSDHFFDAGGMLIYIGTTIKI